MDLEHAINEFIKYTNNYDLSNSNIERKQKHSLRVMEISRNIAERLKLKKDDVDLATLIGLLHDIARFEQYTQYATFRDFDSFDHGDVAVQILDKDMRNYIDIDKYDDIIKIAIKNHNKYQIEDGLSDEEMFFAKIIRDADKIDILYEATGTFWVGEEDIIENSILPEDLFNVFKSNKNIQKVSGRKYSKIDSILIMISFIFDLYFKESFVLIKNSNYINKIIERFDFKDVKTKEKMNEIKNIAEKYIDEQINK